MNRGAFAAAAVSVLAALSAVAARADEPPPPAGQPGLRIVGAQSAVIGGNAAAARERALDDALRQAIDQALVEMVDAPTRLAQAKGVKAIEARARSYVRRYRTLDEGEANGTYTVHLEAEVDEVALRRAAERMAPSSTGATASGGGPARGQAPGMLVVSTGSTAPSAGDAAPALAAALGAAGARAQKGAPVTDPGAAVLVAGRAALSQVAFVTSQAHDEGPVRGTGKVAASCRVSVRVVAVASGLPIAEQAATPRAFADRDEAARTECLSRAASELAPRLVPTTAGGGVAAPGDLRTITIEAVVQEPAAVLALLKALRSIGAVSSAELRRVSPGRAEVRVRTRTLAPALAPALSRDASGPLELGGVETAGDLIRLRVRLRAAPTPPPAGTTTP
jgi:hypothetical protein